VSDYTDLGYANGWKDDPKEVKKCKKKGHERQQKTIGNCLTEYYCDKCRYKYKVDSSG